MIDRDLVRELAQERIDEQVPGAFLVEVHVDSANRIFVEIDHMERGVSIDDCIKISRNIEHNLDREIEDFELEVSSCGLDQPFRVWEQYVKNVGRELKVRSKEGKEISGVLKKAENQSITLFTTRKEKVEGKKKKIEIEEEIDLKIDEITEAKLIISFK